MENRVEELRKRLGMNQEDFAKALKVSRQTVSSIETGKYNPSLELGTVMTCKYFYWNTSKSKKRYQEKIENEKIELHDELKSQLRDKSGRYAYAIGLMTVSISIIIFSILGQLEVIDNSRLTVLYLGGYLIFQIVIGIVIFKQLLKKYE
ncbi:MAG: helix-turn-helix transcriptional regulator [Eubacterium sp.]|nr:helix-turn-helix transcriptional regulator [Eubacterium sp.]